MSSEYIYTMYKVDKFYGPERQVLAITAARLIVLVAVLCAIKLGADSVRAIWVARPDLPPVSRFFAGIAGALSRPLRLLGNAIHRQPTRHGKGACGLA